MKLTRQQKRDALRREAKRFVDARIPHDPRKIRRGVAALCAKGKPKT